jgi:hypothetical protein
MSSITGAYRMSVAGPRREGLRPWRRATFARSLMAASPARAPTGLSRPQPRPEVWTRSEVGSQVEHRAAGAVAMVDEPDFYTCSDGRVERLHGAVLDRDPEGAVGLGTRASGGVLREGELAEVGDGDREVIDK